MSGKDDGILLPEHNIYIRRVRKYFKVVSSRPFYYMHNKSLTASQDSDSNELTELKTADTQVLHLTGIALQNDINLYLKYNGKDLFGTKSSGYITQTVAPIFHSFNPDVWMHNLSPYARIVENLGSVVTAYTHYKGTLYELEQLSSEPSIFKVIDG